MPLIEKLLILAITFQALLAVIILVLMGRERVPRVMSGEIAVKDIAVDRSAYPLKARLLSNSFDNQFQLPVLFYVVAIFALWSGGTNWSELALAWGFVALRYAHAAIHVTTNRVHRRFMVYSAGLAVLCLLWLLVLLRLLLS
ncbi:MAG: MAPEG family protein [Devosia sp.]|uniref:MAPEG family protein n=1 Tax=Devosia sp. TaxID=1871048 RepID=UPI0024CB26CB|nr:MAPEG family protein [Devosia sp.]UYN99831.1 MAG: MAPEG family protein [Devosia sp.]